MKTVEIKARVAGSGPSLESPVQIAFEPSPVPQEWELMFMARWQNAQSQSGKFPEATLENGVLTLVCRREDYRLFFHEEVDVIVEETNEQYNRQQQLEEAEKQSAAEARAARRQAELEREAMRQRLKEAAAFNELRDFRAAARVLEEAALKNRAKLTKPEMASHNS